MPGGAQPDARCIRDVDTVDSQLQLLAAVRWSSREHAHGRRRQYVALLLAQGAGGLLRRVDDRGVVAVLDSRMATARYGLLACLAPAVLAEDRCRRCP
jgi:Rad3-related DNA helicase